MGADRNEVRARILEVAEGHFRRIGYHKTSVADISAELGMSPANVYPFLSLQGCDQHVDLRAGCERGC